VAAAAARTEVVPRSGAAAVTARPTQDERMRPLAQMPRDGVAGLLTDIDDTLTTDGRLTPDAYAALARLHAAGLVVVPITGRPAGWCDHIARMWPVSGVVGENGAFWMRFDAAGRRLVRRFRVGEAERAAQRARLDAVAQRILREVPGCALASDQRYREADIAIDFREDVPPLPGPAVDRIVALMEAEGMTAKVSSIHVNGWFGRYDKLGMTRDFLAEAHGIDLDAQARQFVFAGDSPNDAPMFSFFPRSVGVANVRDFLGRIATPPAFVTAARSGAGFVELADYLLAA
jgi:HAD superfamily hydrolase (TIGR01484 family)